MELITEKIRKEKLFQGEFLVFEPENSMIMKVNEFTRLFSFAKQEIQQGDSGGIVDHTKAFFTEALFTDIFTGEIVRHEYENWCEGNYDVTTGLLITRNCEIDTWSKVSLEFKERIEEMAITVMKSNADVVSKSLEADEYGNDGQDFVAHWDGDTLAVLAVTKNGKEYLERYRDKEIYCIDYNNHNGLAIAINYKDEK